MKNGVYLKNDHGIKRIIDDKVVYVLGRGSLENDMPETCVIYQPSWSQKTDCLHFNFFLRAVKKKKKSWEFPFKCEM